MSVFVDTSALYALLDRDDENHSSARSVWTRLRQDNTQLVTTYAVLVETAALLQSRIGLEAVFEFNGKIYPLLDVVWIDSYWYAKAEQRHLKERKRSLSMVDCMSFEVMDARGIHRAFTFDRHFKGAGFTLLNG